MKTEEAKLTRRNGTPLDTVTLDEFETDTQAWERVSLENNGMLGDVILANTFEIPKVDILALAAEILMHGDNAVSARAYVGVKDYPENPGTREMRLYFTGVNRSNLPILEWPDGASAIYDFTMPCPPTC